MIYPEERFLQLSGLQHFKFCRRQWALIHIENQWAENYRTTDGAILHERAHDKDFTESRGDLLITRDMRIFSPTLGVSGACDVLEFHRSGVGIPLKGRDGLWAALSGGIQARQAQAGHHGRLAALRTGCVSGGNALLPDPDRRAVLR